MYNILLKEYFLEQTQLFFLFSFTGLKDIAGSENRIMKVDNFAAIGKEAKSLLVQVCEAILPCTSNPCKHGSCENKNNDYSCICKPGYSGKDCDDGT